MPYCHYWFEAWFTSVSRFNRCRCARVFWYITPFWRFALQEDSTAVTDNIETPVFTLLLRYWKHCHTRHRVCTFTNQPPYDTGG
ncbi:hypothetical protein [Thermaerobacillus caldiproteolyticus]|uniref:hypothetical protein n=1 Tax=Thermaerobacillus caldiproteolyticus TaxID=247480 RepID=UPI0018F17A21|nr:hypothetical protein [Anoxybacillus caldiproteolyticus]